MDASNGQSALPILQSALPVKNGLARIRAKPDTRVAGCGAAEASSMEETGAKGGEHAKSLNPSQDARRVSAEPLGVWGALGALGGGLPDGDAAALWGMVKPDIEVVD